LFYGETSGAPLSHSLLANSAAIGGAYGAASVGHLGSRSYVDWHGQPSSVESRSAVDFADAANVFNPNTTTVYLAVDFAIDGTIVTSGDGAGRVQASLSVLDVNNAGYRNASISGPGTATVMVVLDPGWNSLIVGGSLQTDSYVLGGSGGADFDFLHTFTITGARLANSIGQSLGDVPLVDLQGNSLLPEPAPAGFAALALLAFALRRRCV
jgi:hypothetical protein